MPGHLDFLWTAAPQVSWPLSPETLAAWMAPGRCHAHAPTRRPELMGDVPGSQQEKFVPGIRGAMQEVTWEAGGGGVGTRPQEPRQGPRPRRAPHHCFFSPRTPLDPAQQGAGTSTPQSPSPAT